MRRLVFACKIWLFVWPLVTILTLALRSLELSLPLFIQTLIISATLVPLMVYVIIPYLSRGSGRCRPRSPQPPTGEKG